MLDWLPGDAPVVAAATVSVAVAIAGAVAVAAVAEHFVDNHAVN
jgi:hypothetical protein